MQCAAVAGVAQQRAQGSRQVLRSSRMPSGNRAVHIAHKILSAQFAQPRATTTEPIRQESADIGLVVNNRDLCQPTCVLQIALKGLQASVHRIDRPPRGSLALYYSLLA
jgi:hypothetical protein